MPRPKDARRSSPRSTPGFTDEERAAMREAVRERRAAARDAPADGERDVLAKISEMRGRDRFLAERVHALVRAHAPTLVPRTWYGMPAYAKDGQVLCFFRCAAKFKTRYATLGFSDEAKLDDGRMWATDFALTDLTPVDERHVAELLRRAVG